MNRILKATLRQFRRAPMMATVMVLAFFSSRLRADEIVLTIDPMGGLGARLNGVPLPVSSTEGVAGISGSLGDCSCSEFFVRIEGLVPTPSVVLHRASSRTQYLMAAFPTIAGTWVTVGSIRSSTGDATRSPGYKMLVETSASSVWSGFGTRYPDRAIVDIGLNSKGGIPVFVAVNDERALFSSFADSFVGGYSVSTSDIATFNFSSHVLRRKLKDPDFRLITKSWSLAGNQH